MRTADFHFGVVGARAMSSQRLSLLGKTCSRCRDGPSSGFGPLLQQADQLPFGERKPTLGRG